MIYGYMWSCDIKLQNKKSIACSHKKAGFTKSQIGLYIPTVIQIIQVFRY